MRAPLALAAVILAACSSSPPPPADPPPADPPPPAAPEPPAPAPEPAAVPAATATAAATSAPAAPAAPASSVEASGKIDGKTEFVPKLGQVGGPYQKDGRLFVNLHGASDCLTSLDVKPGDGSMLLMMPWKKGVTYELPGAKQKQGDATFLVITPEKKNDIHKGFKPTGKIEILEAPTEHNAVGRIRVDMKSGDWTLKGELAVKICYPPGDPPK